MDHFASPCSSACLLDLHFTGLQLGHSCQRMVLDPVLYQLPAWSAVFRLRSSYFLLIGLDRNVCCQLGFGLVCCLCVYLYLHLHFDFLFGGFLSPLYMPLCSSFDLKFCSCGESCLRDACPTSFQGSAQRFTPLLSGCGSRFATSQPLGQKVVPYRNFCSLN